MEEPGIFRRDTHFSDKLLKVGANIRDNSFNMQSYIFHKIGLEVTSFAVFGL
jgi:hypothetical protein